MKGIPKMEIWELYVSADIGESIFVTTEAVAKETMKKLQAWSEKNGYYPLRESDFYIRKVDVHFKADAACADFVAGME
jgi:hypothetical protein